MHHAATLKVLPAVRASSIVDANHELCHAMLHGLKVLPAVRASARSRAETHASIGRAECTVRVYRQEFALEVAIGSHTPAHLKRAGV
jgi:hypothetical protein